MKCFKKVIRFTVLLLMTTPLFAYKEIVVDLSEQMAYAIEDGFVAFEGRISSGVIDRETPNGNTGSYKKNATTSQIFGPNPMGEQR